MSGFWHRFADIAKIIAPVVLGTIPGVPHELGPLVGHAIGAAEQLPGATGAQKKAFVLAIVTDALATSAGVGKPIGDATVIIPAVSAGVDAVVTSLKAIQAAHPPTAPVG